MHEISTGSFFIRHHLSLLTIYRSSSANISLRMHSPHGGCIFCLSKNGGLCSASGMSGRSIAATHRSEIWFASKFQKTESITMYFHREDYPYRMPCGNGSWPYAPYTPAWIKSARDYIAAPVMRVWKFLPAFPDTHTCLLLSTFQFAKLIVPYRNKTDGVP